MVFKMYFYPYLFVKIGKDIFLLHIKIVIIKIILYSKLINNN